MNSTTSSNDSAIGAGAGQVTVTPPDPSEKIAIFQPANYIGKTRSESVNLKKIIAEKKSAKVQEGLNIVKKWPKEPPVYLYFGHGKDQCNTNGKLIEDIVPNNCIYVTIEECGMNTTHNEEEVRRLLHDFSDFPKVNERLRKIYIPTFTKYIAGYLGRNEKNIHVKLPGISYNVSMFEPNVYWNNESYFRMSHSGLVERKKFIEEKHRYYNDYFIYKFALEEIGILSDTTIPKEGFLNKILEIVKAKKHSLDYGERIKEHMEEILAMPNTKDEFETMFAGNTELGFDDITKFMNNFYYSIPKERIVANYGGSVFPAKEKIETYLNDKSRFPFERLTIEEYKEIFSLSVLRFSNKDLMKFFPGIHFNLVCRGVDDKCKTTAEIQRAKSAERNIVRRNVTQKLVPSINTVLKSILNYKSSEPERLNVILKQIDNVKLHNARAVTNKAAEIGEFFVFLLQYDLDSIDPTNTESFSRLLQKIERMKNVFGNPERLAYFSPSLQRQLNEKLFETHRNKKITDDQLILLYFTLNHRDADHFKQNTKIEYPPHSISEFVEEMGYLLADYHASPYIPSILVILTKYTEKQDTLSPYKKYLRSQIYNAVSYIQSILNNRIQLLPAYETQLKEIRDSLVEKILTNNNALYVEVLEEKKEHKRREEEYQRSQEEYERRKLEEARKAEETRQAEEAKKSEETRILKGVVEKINVVLKKTYKSPHDKQVAIYNTLLTLKDQIAKLTDKSEILDLLETNGMLKGKAPVIGKIKTLLSIKEGGRRTRKHKHTKKRITKTRKQ